HLRGPQGGAGWQETDLYRSTSMTIKMEPIHAGEFLLSEGPGNISRESINVA
ncbi:hypothetical protein PLA106_28711, partial [Pseudomonas amygdali pv. lachrymans str. M302278]